MARLAQEGRLVSNTRCSMDFHTNSSQVGLLSIRVCITLITPNCIQEDTRGISETKVRETQDAMDEDRNRSPQVGSIKKAVSG
jgi:hypothetical protein